MCSLGQCSFMLVRFPVTGGASYIKRTSVQLYQYGTGQVTGVFEGEQGELFR